MPDSGVVTNINGMPFSLFPSNGQIQDIPLAEVPDTPPTSTFGPGPVHAGNWIPHAKTQVLDKQYDKGKPGIINQ